HSRTFALSHSQFMARDDREMTFIVIPHGRDAASTRSYEVTYRRLKVMLGAGAVIALLLMMMAGSWLYLAGQAARVPGLRSEVRDLRRDRQRLDELARTLDQVTAEYTKVRSMLGADSTRLPAIVDTTRASGAGADSAKGDSAAADSGDAEGEPVAAARSSLPRRWPLDARGFVTRGHLARLGRSHPGMDIAVASGSRILAAGGGTVAEVGEDSVYGRYVRIAHPDGYESLYAHASSLLVRARQRVPAGGVIALSGSTGVSTAPHLHFEIRKDGHPVDPGTLIQNPN
ncbi:M23 family metallopeptidase, partial [Longimicrobium sp.]|uniref:M23 family metallopeptidase n=1 Tax=Longimicrobium sp. TaxID=2029185 RepID=UPI002E32FD94